MKKKRGLSLIAAVFAVFGAIFLQRAFAADGRVYVSSATVQRGRTFSVSVRIRPQTPVTTVDVSVAYDTSRLQYVSASTAGSPFGLAVRQEHTSGRVQFIRGNLSPIAGDSLIGTITFRALTAGRTNLTPTGDAAAAGTSFAPTMQAGAVNVTSPPVATPTPTPNPTPRPTPPPTPRPNPSPSPSPAPSPSPSPSPSPAPSPRPTPRPNPSPRPSPRPSTPSFAVSANRGNIQFTRAAIRATTTRPARVSIRYGINGRPVMETPLSRVSTRHAINLPSNTILPGTTYTYVAIAQDARGNTIESQPQTFKTQGFTVRVDVRGAGNRPLANQMVALTPDSMGARTNGDGIATFNDVAAGRQTVEIMHGDQRHTQLIQVANTMRTSGGRQVEGAPQNFSVIFADASTSSPLRWIAIGGVILVLAGVTVALIKSGKFSRNGGWPPPSSSSGLGGISPTTPAGSSAPQPPASPTAAPTAMPTPPSPSVPVTPTVVAAPPASETDQLLQQVPGEAPSNPGTVIAPHNPGQGGQAS